MPSENPDVLIVGGSTVGLCTALFLSRAGMRPLVVERRPAPLTHPRAMGIGPRTVEILRAAGLADAVDAQCVDMTGDDLQMFATPTLADADLDALSRQAPPRADAFGRLTPQTLRGTCPQGRLDQVVVDEARAAGARIEFGTELIDFVQDDEGVTARVAGADGVREIRARYLVATDGARSGVRKRLGIATSGPGVLGDPLISVLFHADLTELTHGHTFVVCDITTPKAPGGLLPVDGRREWIYHFRYSPDSGEKAEDFTPEKCAARIREAIGPAADVEPEVVSILPWQVRGLIADRFRSGRVFLAGDAAHVIPPVGAFGMNTGVADAHNLAWKLAHVVEGNAGDALLDTYEAERAPVARTALEQSMLRLEDPSLHWASGQEGRERRARAGALNAPVVHLGYRYESAAVLDAHPELPSGEDVEPDLDGSPGSRLPHHWLTGKRDRVSTLDLIDYRFTLLTGARGQEWLDALGKVAARLGVAVDGHRIEDGTTWTAQVGVEDSGALLVRPDGFVAWRAPSLDDAPEIRLEQALAALLARQEQPS
ncbi:FAD-dependent monooxygenase [Streptomyces sp. NPDC056486]|uniref:FAD-dependent monooxygenase n=1 Tax=Streptomyces sp. NPDC056486 TaxID=3345835 RepID=UPI0036CACD2E